MESLTAAQATTKWQRYTLYKAECMRANVFPTGFQAWEQMGCPDGPINHELADHLADLPSDGFGGASPPEKRTERESRKATPVWSGFLRYFPDAVCAVARLSKKANDIHNPGEPLGWSRDKSSDHTDAEARHLITPELVDDETGELHAAAKAWRAMADLQLLEEKRLGEKSLAVQIALNKATTCSSKL